MGKRRGKQHLYSLATMRGFEKEYGKKKGDYVFRAVVGRVKRERKMKRRR